MLWQRVAVITTLFLGPISGAAHASYLFTVNQVGNDVEFSGSGSLDLSAFFRRGESYGSNFVDAGQPGLRIGSSDTSFDVFQASISYTDKFGTGGYMYLPSGAGPQFGFDARNGNIFVREGFEGSTFGISTSTVLGTTLGSLGLTPGTYEYTLSPGTVEGSARAALVPTNTITVQIGGTSMSPVPLPASAPMFGGALVGLVVLGTATKRRAKRAA